MGYHVLSVLWHVAAYFTQDACKVFFSVDCLYSAEYTYNVTIYSAKEFSSSSNCFFPFLLTTNCRLYVMDALHHFARLKVDAFDMDARSMLSSQIKQSVCLRMLTFNRMPTGKQFDKIRASSVVLICSRWRSIHSEGAKGSFLCI